jgi:hypothetical protein
MIQKCRIEQVFFALLFPHPRSISSGGKERVGCLVAWLGKERRRRNVSSFFLLEYFPGNKTVL